MVKMILMVTGGRDYNLTPLDSMIIEEVVGMINPDKFIHGDAVGADKQTAAEIANLFPHIPIKPYPPQYDKYPKKVAPLKRNEVMAEKAHFCLEFPGHRGTAYTVKVFNGIKFLTFPWKSVNLWVKPGILENLESMYDTR